MPTHKSPSKDGHPATASLELTPRSRESTVAGIVNQLVARFSAGDIPPGGKLPPERQLAEALGVGRSAIRESLKALDLLGMIEVRQGDGTYLRQGASNLLPQVVEWGLLLDTPQTMDLIETRFHLETIMARLAAERVTAEEISKIAACLTEMEQAEGAPDFARADTDFHLAIAAAAKNRVLADMLTNVKSLLHVWVLRAIRQSGERESTIKQHRAILAAISHRQPDAAFKAMKAHMEAATANLRKSLRS